MVAAPDALLPRRPLEGVEGVEEIGVDAAGVSVNTQAEPHHNNETYSKTTYKPYDQHHSNI
jgi:hypothetical protein